MLISTFERRQAFADREQQRAAKPVQGAPPHQQQGSSSAYSFLGYGQTYTVIRSSDETYSRALQSMTDLGNRFVVGFDRAVASLKTTNRRDRNTGSPAKLELIPTQECTCSLYLVCHRQHLQ